MEARPRTLYNFVDAEGNEPFRAWLNGLRDAQGRARIRIHLNRVQAGNLGDHRSAGDGVQELRLDFGPGYRVYFAEIGEGLLLLAGGDKSTQAKDIRIAKDRWSEHNAKDN